MGFVTSRAVSAIQTNLFLARFKPNTIPFVTVTLPREGLDIIMFQESELRSRCSEKVTVWIQLCWGKNSLR